MESMTEVARDLYREVTTGAQTEFAFLATWQQENLRQACSVIEEGLSFAMGNHWSILNAQTADIASAFFAGIDKTGARAHALGLAHQPQTLSLGQYDPEAFPRPVLVTFESKTSSRCAMLLISFVERDMRGYGVWDTAEVNVLAIERSFEEAADFGRRFARAFSDLMKAGELSHDYAERLARGTVEVVGGGDF